VASLEGAVPNLKRCAYAAIEMTWRKVQRTAPARCARETGGVIRASENRARSGRVYI
jgi:hypothetical protein